MLSQLLAASRLFFLHLMQLPDSYALASGPLSNWAQIHHLYHTQVRTQPFRMPKQPFRSDREDLAQARQEDLAELLRVHQAGCQLVRCFPS